MDYLLHTTFFALFFGVKTVSIPSASTVYELFTLFWFIVVIPFFLHCVTCLFCITCGGWLFTWIASEDVQNTWKIFFYEKVGYDYETNCFLDDWIRFDFKTIFFDSQKKWEMPIFLMVKSDLVPPLLRKFEKVEKKLEKRWKKLKKKF